tara:strand:- start:38526 stop:39593 length:1068 start_codon:yes stop_codon:yes gene_type:complete
MAAYGQSDTSKQANKGSFEYTFYVDAYYSYDLNEPHDHNRPDFLFQYNRNNQIGINMAVAKVSYTRGGLTANLGLNTGDFPAANMAHERELLRMLYEANINYRFLKKFEFTMGMFGSHMGFESALSYDNLLTSHSLTSEWTPYYLAGAKLGYNASDKWYFGVTVANGNQTITENEGNTNKLLGLQATWSPSEKVTVNYSNMYYNDQPDSAANFIFYNNLYSTMALSKKLDLVVGFDFALSDNRVTNKQDNIYAGSLLARYKLSDQFAVAGRYEYYSDEAGVFIQTDVVNPFVTSCYSLNFDYSPIKNVKFRLEGRMFSAEKPFYRDDSDYDPNTSTTIKYTNSNSNILFTVQAKF